MIEKLVTIPAKAGYKIGKAGAEQGAKILPSIKNYLAPVQSVDDIDYYSRIEKRRKNKDLKEFIEQNPEKKETLEACIRQAADKNRASRRWAGVIDTVDKATAPIGLGACYLIYMGGVGFPLALAEEAVEMTALKGPFMAYYAKKTGKKGLKRIPKWLAYEFFSHVLPFGDILDLRNNYVKGVDKDIETSAVDLFREKEGLKKQGWLKRLWGNKKAPSPKPLPLASEEEGKKMELENELKKLPDPYMPINRVQLYMDSLQEDGYKSFIEEKGKSLPQSLERFVKWGFNPHDDVKWYSNSGMYMNNVDKIAGAVDNYLGDGPENKQRSMTSAYELEIGGEKKWIVEFSNTTSESYRKVHDVPDDQPCIQPMYFVTKDHKLVVDAKTGKVEDSHMKRQEYHMGLLEDKPLKEEIVPEKYVETA